MLGLVSSDTLVHKLLATLQRDTISGNPVGVGKWEAGLEAPFAIMRGHLKTACGTASCVILSG